MKYSYYCLVAGLPDIFPDDAKIPLSINEFKFMLADDLHNDDYKIIQSWFWRYDNKHLLQLLENKTPEFSEPGNLNEEDLNEIFAFARDDSIKELQQKAPVYFASIINGFKEESPVIPGKSWTNQINELYYNWLDHFDNDFIRRWYRFEMDLNNILTAVNCKKYNIDIEPELIGQDDITEKLVKSNARDFGIGNEFPMIEQILRAAEDDDVFEREKRIDRIKWDLLDDRTFFHYFTIERIFSFMVKLNIVDRWMKLDTETGRELFKELINNLETSYEFPDEFVLK